MSTIQTNPPAFYVSANAGLGGSAHSSALTSFEKKAQATLSAGISAGVYGANIVGAVAGIEGRHTFSREIASTGARIPESSDVFANLGAGLVATNSVGGSNFFIIANYGANLLRPGSQAGLRIELTPDQGVGLGLSLGVISNENYALQNAKFRGEIRIAYDLFSE